MSDPHFKTNNSFVNTSFRILDTIFLQFVEEGFKVSAGLLLLEEDNYKSTNDVKAYCGNFRTRLHQLNELEPLAFLDLVA